MFRRGDIGGRDWMNVQGGQNVSLRVEFGWCFIEHLKERRIRNSHIRQVERVSLWEEEGTRTEKKTSKSGSWSFCS